MASALENIKHIVVLMFENRSFDNVLGWLYDSTNPPPRNQSFEGLDPLPPANIWKYDDKTYAIQPRHGTDMTQPNPDPNEVYQHVTDQMFGNPPAPEPTMLGFLADYATAAKVANPTQTPNIMNCFQPSDVPVISELAYWYSVCDHWYASVPSQTFTNRSFVHAGTASGYVDNQIGAHVWDIWKNDTPTIFNLMEANSPGSWRVYYGGLSFLCNAYTCQLQMKPYGPDSSQRRFYPMSDFYTDLKNYQSDPEKYPFPSYTFIEPNFFSLPFIGPENDEHPQTVDTLDGASNVLYGEELIADVFNALAATDLWSETLFIVTFDEHGGTYDHYAPRPSTAVRPDDVVIAKGQPGYSGFTFDRYGVRVPAVVMSPWIPKGTVSNTVFDHTSIINTICATFLPSGTHLLARDQVANNLGSLLTCTSPRTDLPTLKPRKPPTFNPLKVAEAGLTDFQKHLIAAGLHSLGEDASHLLESHADAWRILERLAK